MNARTIGPIHPGDFIAEIIEDLEITQYALAKAMGITQARLKRVVEGQVGVTANTALRLARVLNTTPEYWLALQNSYDIETEVAEMAEALEKFEPLPQLQGVVVVDQRSCGRTLFRVDA